MFKYHFKKVFVILALVSLVVLQGCIEIVEEVSINNDQSGHISLTVGAEGDANPLLALIGQFSDMSFMDEIKSEVSRVSQILKNQDGISNVKFTENRRMGNMELSFDFENDKKLNAALYASAGYDKTVFQPNLYKIRKHKFVRKNTTDWIVKLMEQEKENIPDDVVFDLVKMKSVYHFPQEARSIRGPKNMRSSNNSQTFSSSNFLSFLIENKTNTRIKIKY